MSGEEHLDSEFYYPEEQETAEKKASHRGRHFNKLKLKHCSGDTGRDGKLVLVVLIFVIRSAI